MLVYNKVFEQKQIIPNRIQDNILQMSSPQKIAIIGTGITALSIAFHIPKIMPTAEITLFDKARKPGGRLSTRQSRNNKSIMFDHGAPFLNDNNLTPELKMILVQQLKCLQLKKMNICREENKSEKIWKQVYIAPNGFQSVSQMLIKQKIKVHQSYYNCRISSITRNQNNNLFTLQQQENQQGLQRSKIGHLQFNQVFCCVPFQQTLMLKQNEIQLKKHSVEYYPAWVIMVQIKSNELNSIWRKETDIVQFKNKNISCAIKQNSKFNLSQTTTQNWSFYMNENWSLQNKSLSKQQVQKQFLDLLKEDLKEFQKQSNQFNFQLISAHRWLYSKPKQSSVKQYLSSNDKKIVLAGDWVGNLNNIGQCWDLGQKIVHSVFQPLKIKGKL